MTNWPNFRNVHQDWLSPRHRFKAELKIIRSAHGWKKDSKLKFSRAFGSMRYRKYGTAQAKTQKQISCARCSSKAINSCWLFPLQLFLTPKNVISQAAHLKRITFHLIMCLAVAKLFTIQRVALHIHSYNEYFITRFITLHSAHRHTHYLANDKKRDTWLSQHRVVCRM